MRVNQQGGALAGSRSANSQQAGNAFFMLKGRLEAKGAGKRAAERKQARQAGW